MARYSIHNYTVESYSAIMLFISCPSPGGTSFLTSFFRLSMLFELAHHPKQIKNAKPLGETRLFTGKVSGGHFYRCREECPAFLSERWRGRREDGTAFVVLRLRKGMTCLGLALACAFSPDHRQVGRGERAGFRSRSRRLRGEEGQEARRLLRRVCGSFS